MAEWCNENTGRGYPLSEEATGVDDDGVTMSTGVLADLSLSVPPGHDDIRVSHVTIRPGMVTVMIESSAGALACHTGAPVAGAVALSPLAPDVSGWVVFGDASACSHTFSTAAQSGVERRAIRVFDPPGVRLFRHKNRPEPFADGTVRLVPGRGMYARVADDDPQRVIVGISDADRRAALVGPCAVDWRGSLTAVGGVRPVDGRITLRVV